MKPKFVTVNTGELFGRKPPTAAEAERSLIGSAILDPRVVDDVALVVRPEMFGAERHRTIWTAIHTLYEAHGGVDLVQLETALIRGGSLNHVGGVAYLMDIAEAVPSAASAPFYAQQVADAHMLRQLVEASSLNIHDAYTVPNGTTESVRKVLDMAESRLFKITDTDTANEPQQLAELIEAELNASGEAEDGIPTGYNDLDRILGGLRPGELTILAARPSVGKTALAMNMAEQVAFAGFAVGVFSMEMGRVAITQRLMSARSGVDATKIRAGRATAEEIKKIRDAARELSAVSFIIDDKPGLSVTELRSMARRMKGKHKIDCLFIDYMQLMNAPGSSRESRQAEVSEISRGIKALARELDIPVVCLSQLNRESENRIDKRPKLSDLRESGSIEQDADVVLLLHREEYHHRGDPAWAEMNDEKIGLAEVIVAKQRNGPCEICYLHFDGPTMRFRNRAGPGRGDRVEPEHSFMP